jgi:predicted phage tail protein
MIPAEIAAVIGLGLAFSWWTSAGTNWLTTLTATVFVPILALFGVSVAQSKVYSPETYRTNMRAATNPNLSPLAKNLLKGPVK